MHEQGGGTIPLQRALELLENNSIHLFLYSTKPISDVNIRVSFGNACRMSCLDLPAVRRLLRRGSGHVVADATALNMKLVRLPVESKTLLHISTHARSPRTIRATALTCVLRARREHSRSKKLWREFWS